MPAKKAGRNVIKIIQNKQINNENKSQIQKNEPKLVKKFVEIKDDR